MMTHRKLALKEVRQKLTILEVVTTLRNLYLTRRTKAEDTRSRIYTYEGIQKIKTQQVRAIIYLRNHTKAVDTGSTVYLRIWT